MKLKLFLFLTFLFCGIVYKFLSHLSKNGHYEAYDKDNTGKVRVESSKEGRNVTFSLDGKKDVGEIAVILPLKQRIVIAVVCCGERQEETEVMIKSAIALSSSILNIIIFTENSSFEYFQRMKLSWPADVLIRVELVVNPVVFPPSTDSDKWINLFKPCASFRLFLPIVLKDIDALIYTDTDIVFMSPIENTWSTFTKMNSTQYAALSPEHVDSAIGWYNRFAKHPYYGKLGVNSGLMLMNLTRMRSSGWNEYIEPIYTKYKTSIVWGDQDIINIIFHYHPENLLLFGCEYNYHPDHCMYMSACKSAEKSGIMILHGIRRVFVKDEQPAFKAVYKAWSEYDLHSNMRQDLYYPMQRYLLKTMNTNCGDLFPIFWGLTTKMITVSYLWMVLCAGLKHKV